MKSLSKLGTLMAIFVQRKTEARKLDKNSSLWEDSSLCSDTSTKIAVQ